MESLIKYFSGIAVKFLSAVDAEPRRSNQHEIGSNKLKNFLGDPKSEKIHFKAKFIYLEDDHGNTLKAEGEVTWYDSRSQNPERAPEYRLYYKSNVVTDRMSEGDFLIIAKIPNNEIMLIITSPDTTNERQIRWLFGIEDFKGEEFSVADVDDDSAIGYARRTILEELDVDIEISNEQYLDLILERFGQQFPTTKEFSSFAREITPCEISPVDFPDGLLMHWWNTEEVLFRTFEKYLVESEYRTGFKDVEHLLKFARSVFQRRSSRAGLALENHLEELFKANQITHSRGKMTENKSKPDFVFPGIKEYHNETFPRSLLTMLGAKSTCKDRWRQVLSEANEIEYKHLLTLEPGISVTQTDEMKSNKLQLVLPSELHETYTVKQQLWILNLHQFIDIVRCNQTNV